MGNINYHEEFLRKNIYIEAYLLVYSERMKKFQEK